MSWLVGGRGLLDRISGTRLYHWKDFVNLNVSAFYFSDSGQFFLVLVTSHFGGMSAFFGLEIPTTGLCDIIIITITTATAVIDKIVS